MAQDKSENKAEYDKTVNRYRAKNDELTSSNMKLEGKIESYQKIMNE